MQVRYVMKIKGSWPSNIIDMGMEWKCAVKNDTQTLSMEGRGTETSSMRMEKLLVFSMVDLLRRRSFVLLLFYQFKEVAGELGFDILKAESELMYLLKIWPNERR